MAEAAETDRHVDARGCWPLQGFGEAPQERAHVPQAYRPRLTPSPGPPGKGLERSRAVDSCVLGPGLRRRPRRLTFAKASATIAASTAASCASSSLSSGSRATRRSGLRLGLRLSESRLVLEDLAAILHLVRHPLAESCRLGLARGARRSAENDVKAGIVRMPRLRLTATSTCTAHRAKNSPEASALMSS